MNGILTAAALIVLTAAAAYATHRLTIEHADRTAAHRHSTPLPGHRGRGTPPPPVEPGPSRSGVQQRKTKLDGDRRLFGRLVTRDPER